MLPFDSKNCAANDTTYIDHTIAEVLARCVVTGKRTQVAFTVLSRATNPADHIQAMSQRFCGQVIDATGPEGWEVAVERENGLHDLAGQVTWTAPASTGTGQAKARRISGFSVTLQGKWRTRLGHYVAFTSSVGPNAVSPHDCPYPFR